MKSFSEFLEESPRLSRGLITGKREATDADNKLVDDIRKLYLKHMPRGWAIVRYSNNLMPTIQIRCGAIGDGNGKANKDDLSGGYLENDPLTVDFTIWFMGDGRWRLEHGTQGTGIMHDPDPEKDRHMAFGRLRLKGHRKVESDDPKKILASLDRWFKKTATAWKGTKNMHTNANRKQGYDAKYFR